MSIINEKSLETIKKIRTIMLRSAIWIFVGSVILGAVLILIGGTEAQKYILKVASTLLIVALMMIVSVNNLKRLEDKRNSIQVFALIGFISNFIWMVLWTIAIWEIAKIYDDSNALTVFGKIAFIATYLSLLGIIVSNVLSIKEYERTALVRPLKITAVACAVCEQVLGTIAVILNYQIDARLGMLMGFSGFVWIITTVAALAIADCSKGKREERDHQDALDEKKDEEKLRSEIEQKVRAEMIEAEVRKKVEAEVRQKIEAETKEKAKSDLESK